MKRRFRRSNWVMHLVQRLLRRSSQTSPLVSGSSRVCMIVDEILCFSHPHHPPRAMHPRRHDPDVQDPRVELPHHGIQFKCTVLGRNQVWGLPGHNYWDVDVCMFPMHLTSEGELSVHSVSSDGHEFTIA